MRKSFVCLLFVLLCGVAVAELCPRCKTTVLPTDAFCADCGFGVSEWRRQREVRRSAPVRVVHKSVSRNVQPASQPIATVNYGLSGIDRNMKKSNVVTPLKFGLVGAAGLPWDENCVVHGANFSVWWGTCHTVNGFCISGFANRYHTMRGISVGFANSGCDLMGLQVGFMNAVDELKGIQIGIINIADSRMSSGIQIGVFNIFKPGWADSGRTIPGINVCF